MSDDIFDILDDASDVGYGYGEEEMKEKVLAEIDLDLKFLSRLIKTTEKLSQNYLHQEQYKTNALAQA